jgi:hypothetical protein
MEERLASQQEHLLGMSKDLIEAQLEREHSNKSLERALAEIVKLKWELRAAQGAKTSAQEKALALERRTSQLSGDLTSAQEKALALEHHTSQLSGELQSVKYMTHASRWHAFSHSLELKSFIKELHAKTVVLSWRRLLRSLQLHTAGSALLLSLIQMRRHALQEICESEAEVLLRTIKLDNMRKRLEQIPPPNSKPTDPPRAMVLAHEWVSTADYTSLHGQWRRMRTAGQGQFGLLPALEPTRGAKMTPGELYHAAALARAKQFGTIRGNRPGSRNSGQLGV